MKKKYLIIGGFIVLIFGFFGFNSYQSLEEQNGKFTVSENQESSIEQEILPNNYTTENEGKPVFKFKSYSNDLENEIEILQTNNEITYHTFDFNKKLISFRTQTKGGDWKTFEFKLEKSVMVESISGLRGMEFEINNARCYQIWISSLGNIGYEFTNGQKLVFYEVQEIN